MTYLFTKPNCEKCEHIKTNADLSGVSIQHLDNNRDALALLAYCELVSEAEKPGLPLLFDDMHGPIVDFSDLCAHFGIDSPSTDKECEGASCQL